jgi:KUP system potassium uptake protein
MSTTDQALPDPPVRPLPRDRVPFEGTIHSSHEHGSSLGGLALGALGVVYGDIGTSPLYALRECFSEHHGLAATPANVLGVLSLIVWSLVMVICVKYIAFVTRADNGGEGGVLALLSLTRAGRAERSGPRGRFLLLLLGLFGAALLYGDGMITPAISVLSAVEGLNLATHAFEPYVIPITIAILFGLFAVQSRGTAKVATVFGPTILLWFLVIGALGLAQILAQAPDHPSVFQAMNPLHGLRFLFESGHHGFLTLGSVVLVVTGGEALYADMGHFGARPIRIAWFVVVLPALLLNYFGQGALLMEHAEAVRNPFFELAPAWGLYPLVALSTISTIIASQALISGAFSLTQQAIQLDYVPRFTVVHTSGHARGQIYVPMVNRILMVLCILLVLGFQSSAELADAYGMAVTATMTITSLLFYAYAREHWHWSRLRAGLVVGIFLAFDLAFLGVNLLKLFEGGWFPLAVGAVLFVGMTTWRRGRTELGRALGESRLPLELFLADIGATKPYRVTGTAIVMTSNPVGVPNVLLHHLKHNRVLHERVVLMSFRTAPQPEVSDEGRLCIDALEHGFYRVVVDWGFMEKPSMARTLELCAQKGLHLEVQSTTFFLGRETLLSTGKSGMMAWRKNIFALLARNAPSVTAYLGIPPNRVIEVGTQVEI